MTREEAMSEQPIYGFCASGHGRREVKEYEGYLLCLRYCWAQRKAIAANLKAVVNRRRGKRKGTPIERARTSG